MNRLVSSFTISLALAVVLSTAPATALTLTNATLDLDAAAPTVAFVSLDDDFGGFVGEVFQVVNGTPTALTVGSWANDLVVAELASTVPGDYLMAVRRVNGVLGLFTLTIPDTTADPPCFNDDIARFVDCGNGTVTDTVTGLIWLKNAGTDCLPGLPTLTWQESNEAAAALEDGPGGGGCNLTDGSSPGDWRLPTDAEFQAIIDQGVANGCAAPFLPNTNGLGCSTSGNPFLLVEDFYWTSTTVADNPGSAWIGDLSVGGVGNGTKTGSLGAWPVRGGK